MKGKILGIFGLLVALCVFMTLMTSDPWYNIGTSKFLQAGNIQNLLSRTALYGILGVGVAFVIISSGIDLSIGSMVCLSGVLLAMFLHVEYRAIGQATVVQVVAEDDKFALQSNPGGISAGDHVRYSGGRRASTGLFTVTDVDGATLSVSEDLPRDDTQGEIAKAIAVKEIERFESDDAEHGARIVIDGVHDLHVDDQLTLVHPKSGLKTEKITQVESSESSTIVFIKNDPGERLTTE